MARRGVGWRAEEKRSGRVAQTDGMVKGGRVRDGYIIQAGREEGGWLGSGWSNCVNDVERKVQYHHRIMDVGS